MSAAFWMQKFQLRADASAEIVDIDENLCTTRKISTMIFEYLQILLKSKLANYVTGVMRICN